MNSRELLINIMGINSSVKTIEMACGCYTVNLFQKNNVFQFQHCFCTDSVTVTWQRECSKSSRIIEKTFTINIEHVTDIVAYIRTLTGYPFRGTKQSTVSKGIYSFLNKLKNVHAIEDVYMRLEGEKCSISVANKNIKGIVSYRGFSLDKYTAPVSFCSLAENYVLNS